MSIRLLIDMNLSPDWEPWFKANGIDALHWSDIRDPRATDAEILDWARTNTCVIFTHDLDFGADTLPRAERPAGTRARCPA